MRRASELKDRLDVDQDEIIRPAKRQSIFILLLAIGFSLFLVGVVVLAIGAKSDPIPVT